MRKSRNPRKEAACAGRAGWPGRVREIHTSHGLWAAVAGSPWVDQKLKSYTSVLGGPFWC